MPAQIEVVNQALIILESDPITSIDDDTETAIVAKNLWDMSRRFVLRDTVFNFAVRYADIASDPQAPPHPQINVSNAIGFKTPNDNLRVLEVLSESRPVRFFRVVGRHIYTDQEPIQVKYIFDADIGLWDDTAAEMLSFYLANKMAMAITQSRTVKKQALTDYGVAKAAATVAAGLEGTSPSFRVEGRLTRVRHAASGRESFR